MKLLRGDKSQSRVLAASVVIFACLHLIFILFSGKSLLSENPYNSYARQAASWLQGRLDLGQDYSWLELAVYNGKYYVSFPPFPSYVLLPFSLFFGEQTPDSLIAFFVAALGVVTAAKIALHEGLSENGAVFLAVFLYCGTNLWQITVDGWVWFFAQNMAFTLTLLSFYYSLLGHPGKSVFFLCAAVGCRPFQIIYFPLIAFLFIKRHMPQKREWLSIVCRMIPAGLLGLSYMLLNYARFGNPFEFGHSYLPEFTNSQYGQFSVSYLKDNLFSLIRLPEYDSSAKKIVFTNFNGMNIFVVYPVIVLYILLPFLKRKDEALQKFEEKEALFNLPVIICGIIHVLALCLHKTMGGAHFGNRYIADIIPAIYVALIIGLKSREKTPFLKRVSGLLAALGMLINFTGTLGFYS